VNALSGTALEAAVIVAVFELEAVLVEPTPDLIAFVGALSVPAEGVNATVVVVAFEPAEEDPVDANEEDAPGPEPPAEVFV
jgi:hypothetical protein